MKIINKTPENEYFYLKYYVFFNKLLFLFDKNRGEFLEKLQRARGAVRPNATTYPLFTKSNEELTITVGNWNLSCKKDGELSIINSDGQQQVCIVSICINYTFIEK